MCGKFTAMGSWAEVVSFSQPLTVPARGSGGGEADNDFEVTHRTHGDLNVIVWDAESKRRRIIKMRWGLPELKNANKVAHYHARGETIDVKPVFASLFAEGRRGIVAMKTFNETPYERDKEQWTINPQDGQPRGFAFLCQGYKNDKGVALLACCMVTVSANQLLRDTILKSDPDPRMPAILRDESVSDDWTIWLGEKDVPLDQVKSVLQTMEGENWTIAPEVKPAKRPKPKGDRPKRSKKPAEPTLF